MNPLRSVVFDPEEHAVQGFECGEGDLDAWLRDAAANAARSGSARTFVWVRKTEVVAYYCLSAHSVARSDLPPKLSRGSTDPVPAFLLGKLALHRSYHGQGLGGALLADAMVRVVNATATGPAARFVVVDAINDDAVGFYEQYGFRPIPDNRARLVRKMSDIAKSVAEGFAERPLPFE